MREGGGDGRGGSLCKCVCIFSSFQNNDIMPFHLPHTHIHTHSSGANCADGHICEWVSILVRSGVFKDDSAHPAKYVVDDVRAALALILELEGRKSL